MACCRVHSRVGSQQARHMRLHIYDTLRSVQLSNAILAGFVFSCTTIHLSCHIQGLSDMYAQFSAATWMDHAQLSHYFWLFELQTHTQNQYSLRLQQHNVWPTGGPGPRGVVCGCRQFASVEMSPHQCEQGSLHCMASKCQDHILACSLFSGINILL